MLLLCWRALKDLSAWTMQVVPEKRCLSMYPVGVRSVQHSQLRSDRVTERPFFLAHD